MTCCWSIWYLEGLGNVQHWREGVAKGDHLFLWKNILIKGKKRRSSCDNHNDFILFFFSSNTPNSSQLDFQHDWLSIWLPSFSCWCDLLAVDSYKNWFLINITTNARITWIFWVNIETYLGRVESMLDVATLMLLGRVATHSDDFVLKYPKIKIKMWNFGLVWDHDQSIWKPHWRNQGKNIVYHFPNKICKNMLRVSLTRKMLMKRLTPVFMVQKQWYVN